MVNNIRRLSEEEVSHLLGGISTEMVNLCNPFRTDCSPFMEIPNNEVIIERNGDLTDNYENLIRVLNKKSRSSLFLLHLVIDDKKSHSVKEGFEVDIQIKKDDFWSEGFNIGYNIASIPFYVFDSSFSWCIYKNGEIRIITGDENFFSAYYVSEEQKSEEIETFLLEYFDKGFALECPKNAINLLRFKIEGEWVTNIKKWFKR